MTCIEGKNNRMVKDMTYIKVFWKHTYDDEPVLLYSELDENRDEIRKVEIYRDGMMGYACEDISINGSFLSECEIPELIVINEDTQFEGIEIQKDEFEMIWEKAVNRK